MPKPVYSTPESLQSAHDNLVTSLKPTLPQLLFGSGDVEPSQVHPGTVDILADLTATYVGKLVDAAVDAHDILTDGAGGILPPPTFSPETANLSTSTAAARKKNLITSSSSRSSNTNNNKKKRGWTQQQQQSAVDGGGDANANANANAANSFPEPGSVDDIWDAVHIPTPKVKKPKRAPGAGVRVSWDPSTAGGAAAARAAQSAPSAPSPKKKKVETDWAGLAGVDLFVPRRRVPYASAPNAIETKSFIFPICHDATLYGRIMEVQKARRTIVPLLSNPILMDMVRMEGRQVVRAIEAGRRLGEGEAMALGGGSLSAAGSLGGKGAAAVAVGGGTDSSAVSAGAVSGADTERDEGGERGIMALRNGPADGAVWPGLEDLVPTYKRDEKKNKDT